MKNISLLLVLVLLTCAFGAAQDTPKAEVFLGYTYLRVNSASNVPAFSANGGGGQLVVNFGKWFGAVADIGAVHNGNIGGYHTDTTLTNFLFGPRYSDSRVASGHAVLPDAVRRRVRLVERECHGSSGHGGAAACSHAGDYDDGDQR